MGLSCQELINKDSLFNSLLEISIIFPLTLRLSQMICDSLLGIISDIADCTSCFEFADFF